jgi:hypothetical protein
VDRTDPHALSAVLSGGFYSVFLATAKAVGAAADDDSWVDDARYASLGEKRVATAAPRIARLLCGALDYLPPGDASFADLGRAAVTAARARSSRGAEATRLADEFVRRGIVASEAELEPDTELPALVDVDLERIRTDNRAARRFAEKHRALLRIPDGAAFDIPPRHLVRRSATERRGKADPTDIVFRVRWQREEAHDLGAGFGPTWGVRAGTTLVVEQETGRILSRLTTDDEASLAADRDAVLRRLAADGLLAPLAEQTRALLSDAIDVDEIDGVQALRGVGRMLHIVGMGS